MRVRSNVIMAILKPSPSRPSIFSAGTSQFVKINSAVCDPLMPILSSIRPTEKPGKSFSTIKPLMPRVPCSGAVSAKTEVTRAIPPLVIKRFEPLRMYLSPARNANVLIAAASEPDRGRMTRRHSRRVRARSPRRRRPTRPSTRARRRPTIRPAR